MVLELTNETFDEVVLKSEKPVVVDFWAPWCGPCRMVGPIVDDLAVEYADKVVVAKVNVDDCEEIANRFSIMNIPTILFFKTGELADKQVGAASKAALTTKMQALL